MDVLAIALIGTPDAAVACVTALAGRGWDAQLGDDGPGNSGVDNTNPRLLEELGMPAVKVVEVYVGRSGELDQVQSVAADHGFRLRLHGWVIR